MCAENDVRDGIDAGQRELALSHGKEKLNDGRIALRQSKALTLPGSNRNG
jgi:hypothetical protein